MVLLITMTTSVVNAQSKAKAKPAEKQTHAFGEWRFVQSDKALQYRFRKEKQEGDLLYLKMQFRLNKSDEIFCRTPECKGYYFFFNFANEYVQIDNHYMVYNTFEKIENLPQTIILKLIKDQYGSQYWDDLKNALFYKNNVSGETRKLDIGWSCVDNILDNSTSNRCNSFKKENAEVLK